MFFFFPLHHQGVAIRKHNKLKGGGGGGAFDAAIGEADVEISAAHMCWTQVPPWMKRNQRLIHHRLAGMCDFVFLLQVPPRDAASAEFSATSC